MRGCIGWFVAHLVLGGVVILASSLILWRAGIKLGPVVDLLTPDTPLEWLGLPWVWLIGVLAFGEIHLVISWGLRKWAGLVMHLRGQTVVRPWLPGVLLTGVGAVVQVAWK